MTISRYLDGPRAARLFESLENRYFEFRNALPQGVRELSWLRSTYHGDGSEGPFDGLASLNPVLVGTPWLFWEQFRGLDDDIFVDIAEAGMYTVLASVLLDHLIDGQVKDPAQSLLFLQLLTDAGYEAYRALFTNSTVFWDEYDRLTREHRKGLALEIASQNPRKEYDRDALVQIAHGKVAPIVITTAALCFANGYEAHYPVFKQSLEKIAAASQTLDDIGDWQQDLEKRHRTYFLASVTSSQDDGAGGWPTLSQTRQKIATSWADVEQMKLVVRWLNESIDAVDSLYCPKWITYVSGYLQSAQGHLDYFIREHLSRQFDMLGK